MDDLDNRTDEELQKELEKLEESYIRNFASKFDKEALNNIWEQMKKVKEELRKRSAKDKNTGEV